MTLIVGFVGKDGSIMASDSEASESGHSRFDIEKIWQEQDLLFGYSGNTSIKQAIAQTIKTTIIPQLQQIQGQADRWQTRGLLANALKPVLATAYQGYVGQNLNQLNGALLVLGHDKDGDWLLEIDQNNTPTFYNERGFQAIGSGSPSAYVARALMEKYQLDGKTVTILKVVTYRILDTSIKSIGGQYGVGGNIHIWSSSKDGKFKKISSKEMESIKNTVDQWTTVERESFEALFDNKKPVEDEKVGLPQPLKT